MTITELLQNLHRDTKIVAHARFNKSKRLARQAWWSLFSISFMSISLILITLYERITTAPPPIDLFDGFPNWFISISLSIIILAISITISSAKLDMKSKRLHDSAIRINKISREIELNTCNQSPTPDEYKKLLKKYNNIIQNNTINHDEMDFLIAKYQVNKKYECLSFYKKHIRQSISLIPYYIISLLSLIIIFSIIKNLM
ncbi:TPA: SLATT domain-containing protein [Morganella morganii]|nr:SLATT domain-containing protein [Morganella morganii]HEI7945976.1 SLATT domain-containing protein [Morganella morganii]